jgi:hypothetical protein
MKNVHFGHRYDLELASDELDLFAEEVHDSQQHNLPPNSLSTLGCECDISTFWCYGCGADLTAAQTTEAMQAAEGLGDLETALKWTREKLDASIADDKVAEVLQTVFKFRRQAE